MFDNYWFFVIVSGNAFTPLLFTAKNAVILPNFIEWKFVESHSFRIVSAESPETMQKLCFSTKFSHQEIRRNYGILSDCSSFSLPLPEEKYFSGPTF